MSQRERERERERERSTACYAQCTFIIGKFIFYFNHIKQLSMTNTEWLVAQAYVSFNSFRRRTADRTEAAAVVEYTQAPPATVFLQALQFQMPTQFLFIDCFPQKVQVYLECWVTSIFFTILRREAPYRVPYFPTTPTFLVRFACGILKQ